MVQKQWKHSRRAKFGPWSWGRLYGGGNCFLPFLNIPSHPLTAAASFTVCKHPTSASPHVSAGPWGMSRGSHLLSAGVTRSCELAQLVVWDSQHWLMPVPMSAHCMGSEPPAFQLTEQEPTCVVLRSSRGCGVGCLSWQVQHKREFQQGGFWTGDNPQNVGSISCMTPSCTKPYHSVRRVLFEFTLQ